MGGKEILNIFLKGLFKILLTDHEISRLNLEVSMKDSLDLCNKFGLNLILFFWYYPNEKMFIFSIIMSFVVNKSIPHIVRVIS